ncbi:amino acid adenylation domain-containing protein [Helicobacter sp. 11S02596-1]|uniref:amino acid adenylation domain-containing protein n=1 Tax=Helicobacter sp. 11S02596-1 TaxID=1476194 RepID=UPI0015DED077|nr:amino acid adenylation domain-containing protein [Helicobacter sp. 11S02596-1]
MTSLLPTIPSQTIAIFLPKSIEALISIAGILLSGNVYMPLDIKSPSQRLQAILQNIIPEYIITDSTHKAKLEGIFPKEKILLVENLLEKTSEIKTNFASRIDTDPAYIINTSGSTGVPKGVVVSHRSVIDYIEWILGEPRICPSVNDVIGNQSPFYFDKSLFDIYPTFSVGNKLVLIPEETFIFPLEALKFLEEKRINYIYWVPSILSNISHYDLLKNTQAKLDKIFFGGEAMSAKVLNYWKKFYPQATFGNLYGPSEITDICAYYIVENHLKDTDPIPIGKPCRNTQMLLINEKNSNVCTQGEIGEIIIRGSCLSLGYYNDLEKTNATFVQNPLHQKYADRVYQTNDLGYYNQRGEIVLVGRKDHQIKHNGYRIELGEIEIALRDFEGITNYCVLYVDSQITLCYENQAEIPKTRFLQHLKDRLAKYMLPQVFARFETLPLNANGKIDRVSLKNSLEKTERNL